MSVYLDFIRCCSNMWMPLDLSTVSSFHSAFIASPFPLSNPVMYFLSRFLEAHFSFHTGPFLSVFLNLKSFPVHTQTFLCLIFSTSHSFSHSFYLLCFMNFCMHFLYLSLISNSFHLIGLWLYNSSETVVAKVMKTLLWDISYNYYKHVK